MTRPTKERVEEIRRNVDTFQHELVRQGWLHALLAEIDALTAERAALLAVARAYYRESEIGGAGRLAFSALPESLMKEVEGE